VKGGWTVEGKPTAISGAWLALVGTLLGSSGIAGSERSDLLLMLGAIVALALCRTPKRS
jgi:hypothetical protein